MNKIFTFSLFLAAPLMASEELDTARTALREWVDLEKSISQERETWRREEATMLDLIGALEKEGSILSGRIQEVNATLSQADSRRVELVEREASTDALREQASVFATKMEAELWGLRAWLPAPLSDKLQPFYSRLPANADKTSLGIAERMQTIVGILSTVHKFDEKITLSREMRELAGGDQAEVQVLYLGLASAYYLAPNRRDAGFGSPKESGWQWESDLDLAERIEEAIAIYEGVQQEAKFLPLPVEMEVAR